MGIAGSLDILQSKMSEIMLALEFVRTYLDDLLVITRASLEDHLEKLRTVFLKLREAWLRINAKKCHFVLLQLNTWVVHLQEKVFIHRQIKYKKSSHY